MKRVALVLVLWLIVPGVAGAKHVGLGAGIGLFAANVQYTAAGRLIVRQDNAAPGALEPAQFGILYIGVTFVIDDRWISRDRLEWTLTRTSADGRILQTIQGVVSR